MPLVVQKYGGTSVGTLEHIKNVARHIDDTVRGGNRLIVTISAMGEQTDELLAMAKQLNLRPPRRELDMLLTAGERISAALLAIALDQRRIPSVSLTGSQCGILTDETHGNARITRILGDRIRDGLDQGLVVIVAGFQGVSPRTRDITTLGRGGTDLSAIALAAALGADRCQLYKDVQGVYTADPRVVKQARLVRRLSWGSMNALAWSGASVLHPRGAHLAGKFAIPFEIRSSLELEHPGTLIDGSRAVETAKVEALAHKSAMAMVSCRMLSTGTPAVIAQALDWLWQHGESPSISQQTLDELGHLTLTLAIKSSLVADFRASLPAGGYEEFKVVDGLAQVTIVGQGFQQSPETILSVCRALPQPPRWLDTRNTAITLCVDEGALTSALNTLHRVLIENTPS